MRNSYELSMACLLLLSTVLLNFKQFFLTQAWYGIECHHTDMSMRALSWYESAFDNVRAVLGSGANTGLETYIQFEVHGKKNPNGTSSRPCKKYSLWPNIVHIDRA